MSIPTRLKLLRVAKGLSQSELAARAGVHAGEVSILEGGKALKRLAEALSFEESPEKLLEQVPAQPEG